MNKNQMRAGVTLLILAAAGIALWAYGPWRARNDDRSEYVIGVIGPLTGEGASYGTAMKQGIELALEKINADGGIGGKRIRAVYEDDRLSPKDGVSAFHKLVSAHKIPAVIGSAASRVTLAITPIAEAQKVVLLSPISTADEIKDAGDYIFRNVPPNRMQGKTAAHFVLKQFKPSKAGILFKNDDYGLNLATSFREAIKDGKVSMVFDEPYDPAQKDFRNVLVKLKNTAPDVVFFPGNYQDNALILRQAREAGINVPFVGGDGAFSTELIKLAGDAAENSYYTMMGHPTNPKVDEFVAKFKTKYKTDEEPNVFAYYAYDAAMIICKAIESKGYSADGIKTALYTLEFDGVTGATRFDEFGEVDKPYAVYAVRQGKFQLLPF